MPNGNGNRLAPWASITLAGLIAFAAVVVAVTTRPTRTEVKTMVQEGDAQVRERSDEGDEYVLREVRLEFRAVRDKLEDIEEKIDRE